MFSKWRGGPAQKGGLGLFRVLVFTRVKAHLVLLHESGLPAYRPFRKAGEPNPEVYTLASARCATPWSKPWVCMKHTPVWHRGMTFFFFDSHIGHSSLSITYPFFLPWLRTSNILAPALNQGTAAAAAPAAKQEIFFEHRRTENRF